MAQRTDILKIGLGVVRDGSLLVVRKRGTESYILPGGKPEPGEDDLTALAREVYEELGCGIAGTPLPARDFVAPAANEPGMTVTVRLYVGELAGEPSVGGEIEEMRWHAPNDDPSRLAPSIRNLILPWLLRRD